MNSPARVPVREYILKKGLRKGYKIKRYLIIDSDADIVLQELIDKSIQWASTTGVFTGDDGRDETGRKMIREIVQAYLWKGIILLTATQTKGFSDTDSCEKRAWLY